MANNFKDYNAAVMEVSIGPNGGVLLET